MFNLIRKFRQIPEKKKIIVYGKLAFLKNLFTFAFKITVGIVFKSWFLIAIALYGLFIGYVKNNCSHGLHRNKDNIHDIRSYIAGGSVLAWSSVFYIAYSIYQMYNPSNTTYHYLISYAIAAFAFYSIGMSLWGVYRSKGKTMLIKEYKLTNFATAFNNIVMAQAAILSFMRVENTPANGFIGVMVGFIIFSIGLYLIIDGLVKRNKYYEIINKYPNIVKYLDRS